MQGLSFKSNYLFFSKWVLVFLFGGVSTHAYALKTLSLEDSVALALQNDPWLQGNKLKQSAIEHKSIAASELPDPKVSLNMLNLPTDTWRFDQEAMTQFKVGVTQVFPRGNSLEIKESQLKISASQFPLLALERKAKLKAIVSELWLDAYQAQKNIDLIQSNRELLEQMFDVARASYSSAFGKTRQQDIIQAQLEIVQLEDRLTIQKQRLESTIARLNQWLYAYDSRNITSEFDSPSTALSVSAELPTISLINNSVLDNTGYARRQLASDLSHHPAVLAVDIKRKVLEKDVALAKQQYKPQWGLNASYGYRADSPTGDDRANLFSVGISFDLPLFPDRRQDKKVAASLAEAEAVKTERLLLIKQMISSVDKEVYNLKGLSKRQKIYNEQLLRKIHEQSETSLTAYTNDDGSFSEVVRASIAELNAKTALLNVDVEKLKAIARINYFFSFVPSSADNVVLGDK